MTPTELTLDQIDSLLAERCMGWDREHSPRTYDLVDGGVWAWTPEKDYYILPQKDQHLIPSTLRGSCFIRGETVGVPSYFWHPTRNLAQAFMVVEKMNELGYDFCFEMWAIKDSKPTATFYIQGPGHGEDLKTWEASAVDPAEAISRAAAASLITTAPPTP